MEHLLFREKWDNDILFYWNGNIAAYKTVWPNKNIIYRFSHHYSYTTDLKSLNLLKRDISPCRNCLDYALLTVGSWSGNSRVTFTQPGPGRALPAQLFGKFSQTRAWSDYGHASCFTVSARALDGTRPGRLLVSKFAFLWICQQVL